MFLLVIVSVNRVIERLVSPVWCVLNLLPYSKNTIYYYLAPMACGYISDFLTTLFIYFKDFLQKKKERNSDAVGPVPLELVLASLFTLTGVRSFLQHTLHVPQITFLLLDL